MLGTLGGSGLFGTTWRKAIGRSFGRRQTLNVVITAGEALDRGIWGGLCVIKGLNEWCMNEGLCDRGERFELTEAQAIELGLIKKGSES